MKFSALSDYMDQIVAAKEIPGCVLTIMRNGEIAYQTAKGVACLERGSRSMGLDSIVRTFSMSKLFTATALMILHEEGTFRLDDPVSNYLGEFSSTQVYRGNKHGSPGYINQQRNITIRDLMLHRSGIGYIFTLEDTPLYGFYEKAALFDPQRTTAEMIALLASLPLAFQPGSAELYGHSYDVLGRLIEVLSGQTLEDFLQARLFQPLGMSDTSFMVPSENSERLTDLYTYSPERELIVADRGNRSRCVGPARLHLGGTGVLSTAVDCLAYFQMLLAQGLHGGHQVVSRSVIDLLIQHCLPQRSIPGEGIGSGLVTSSRPLGPHHRLAGAHRSSAEARREPSPGWIPASG